MAASLRVTTLHTQSDSCRTRRPGYFAAGSSKPSSFGRDGSRNPSATHDTPATHATVRVAVLSGTGEEVVGLADVCVVGATVSDNTVTTGEGSSTVVKAAVAAVPFEVIAWWRSSSMRDVYSFVVSNSKIRIWY